MDEILIAILTLVVAILIYMDARIECSHGARLKLGRRHSLPRLESMAWHPKHQFKWTIGHWEKWANRKYGPRKNQGSGVMSRLK